MPKKTYTPEQILNKLCEAEILLNQGTALSVVWKRIGVSDCTYYRWHKEYGGMRIEQENSRLRRVVADLALDSAILKEAAWGNS